MNKTSIAWVRNPDGTQGYTWNPLAGCSPASAGCKNCYAARLASTRLAHLPAYRGLAYVAENEDPDQAAPGKKGEWTGEVRFFPEKLAEPLRRKKPSGIFVCDMGDLFYEKVTNEQIAAVFGVMSSTPQHRYYVLTKRAKRMLEWFDWAGSLGIQACLRANWNAISEFFHNDKCSRFSVNKYGDRMRTSNDAGCSVLNACGVQSGEPLPNVFIGTTIENRHVADERIPLLLNTPAAVRFLSLEPLLDPVDLRAFMGGEHVILPGDRTAPSYNFGIDWVIVGGESGHNARPCYVDWIRSIVRQCNEAEVPCFVKQLGAYSISHRGADVDSVNLANGRNSGCPDCTEGTGWRLALRDRAGGDPDEWPADLRVRQLPEEST